MIKNKILNFFHFIVGIFNLKIFSLKGKRKSYYSEVKFWNELTLVFEY